MKIGQKWEIQLVIKALPAFNEVFKGTRYLCYVTESILTNSAPLGQVGLGVAMSVVLSVCLSVCAIKSQGSKGGPRGAKQSPIDPQIT